MKIIVIENLALSCNRKQLFFHLFTSGESLASDSEQRESH